MLAKKMSVNKLKPTAVIVSLTLIFIMLASACSLDEVGNSGSVAIQSGGARAWLDQPASDATLPMEPFKLKAHAALEGGGVSQIIFMANSVPLGAVPTDASQDLVYAEFDWNPSAPGKYDIQVKAISGAGEAPSGVAHLCITSGTGADDVCGAAPQPPQADITITPTNTPTPTEVREITIETSASPDPVYLGDCLNDEPQSLVIEARPSNDRDAAEVLARAWVEASNGSRQELPKQAMKKNDAGVYTATYDLSDVSPKYLDNQSGRIVYTVSLIDKNKEAYLVSPEKFVTLQPCEPTPTPVVEVKFKLSASPDPVYLGTCKNKEPQVMTIDGYVSDDTAVAEARVKLILENTGGTQTQLFDQAMKKSEDHYTASISLKEVNVKLLDSQAGRLIYYMYLINDIDETYATSYKAAIRALPCIYTPIPEQPVVPEEPEEPAPSRDTNPPSISGGGPSSGTAYFDPNGIDPQRCQPTYVSFQVRVKDSSKISSVVVYYYWASAGAGSTQSAAMSGQAGTYSFTFSPSRGDDKLVYYVRATDVYNNVGQSGTFSFAVIACKARNIPKPIKVPTIAIRPLIVPTIIKAPVIR